MAKVAILKGRGCDCFDGDQYIVDLDRQFEGAEAGDIVCYVRPFFGVNLLLELAIRADGSIAFREWDMHSDKGNNYVHTDALSEKDAKEANKFYKAVVPTQEQIDTVNGLWSGRIRFEGLRLDVGNTLQRVCPIDVKKEEKLIGSTIYLA